MQPVPFAQTRWVLLGTFKSGKSSTAAGFPGTFVFDFEDKVQFVRPEHRQCIDYAVPTSIASVTGAIEALAAAKLKDPKNFPVHTLVFDTAGAWLDMCSADLTSQFITKDEQAKGSTITDYRASQKGSKGWDMLTSTPLKALSLAKRHGFGWIVTVHLKESTVQRIDPTTNKPTEVTVLTPALNPSLRDKLLAAAEFIGKCTMQNITGKAQIIDGKRVPPTTERKCVLEVQAKPGDSFDMVGSNIAMPKELVLNMGEQGSQLAAAYNTAVGL